MPVLAGLLVIIVSLLTALLPAKTQNMADKHLFLSLILLILGMLILFNGLGFSFTIPPQP